VVRGRPLSYKGTYVVGFRGPPQNHMILGDNCSYARRIDVYSQSGDLVLQASIHPSIDLSITGQDRFDRCFYKRL